jgi:hypothetical protein
MWLCICSLFEVCIAYIWCWIWNKIDVVLQGSTSKARVWIHMKWVILIFVIFWTKKIGSDYTYRQMNHGMDNVHKIRNQRIAFIFLPNYQLLRRDKLTKIKAPIRYCTCTVYYVRNIFLTFSVLIFTSFGRHW